MRLPDRATALLLLAAVACAPSDVIDITENEKNDALERLQPSATNEERNNYIEACLEENAVTAYERTPDGLFSGSGVTERDQEIIKSCIETALVEFPPGPQPASPSEHAVLYDLYLDQADCLRGLGIPVEVPTLDSYIEQNGEWSPYISVDPDSLPGTLTWASVNELCPQDPWHYLAGEREE